MYRSLNTLHENYNVIKPYNNLLLQRKEGSTFTPTVFASDIKLRVKSAAIQKSQTDVKRLERGLDYEEIKAIVKYEQAIQDADLPKFHAYPMKLGTTICPELVTHRKVRSNV